jgi:hypothetical protein
VGTLGVLLRSVSIIRVTKFAKGRAASSWQLRGEFAM